MFANLPGLSSSIRLTKHDTILVSFKHVYPKEASILGFFGQLKVVRAIIGTVKILPTQLQNISVDLIFYFSRSWVRSNFWVRYLGTEWSMNLAWTANSCIPGKILRESSSRTSRAQCFTVARSTSVQQIPITWPAWITSSSPLYQRWLSNKNF